jgi:glycosyltransferase involved in cell wall biosynthesis
MEGLGTFTFEIVSRLVKQHPEHSFYFLAENVNRPRLIEGENVFYLNRGLPARHPILFYNWFEFNVPAMLKRAKADVFFSPEGYLSLKSEVPQVCTMHDLNFEAYPEFFPLADRWYYQHFSPKYAVKASRILTVSEFSREDIMNRYGVSGDKIDVLYNGISSEYHNLKNPDQPFPAGEWIGEDPYFIFVGGMYPRKNLIRILHSFEQFKQAVPGPHKLLMVGSIYKESRDLLAYHQQMNFKDSVVFTGRLEERKQVVALLQHALALVYVSLYEGFGLPIAEAMRCGCPVLTGTVTSMPEIAGDAALLVSPTSVEAISAAMQQLAADEGLRSRLSELGLKRSELFSWDKAAEEVWGSLMKAMKN